MARAITLALVLLVAQFQPLALVLACEAGASPAMAMAGASRGAHAAHGSPQATAASGAGEIPDAAWGAPQDEPRLDCPLTDFCSTAPVFALRALEPIRLTKSLHAATLPTPARLAAGRTPAPPTPPPLV